MKIGDTVKTVKRVNYVGGDSVPTGTTGRIFKRACLFDWMVRFEDGRTAPVDTEEVAVYEYHNG